MYNFFHRFFSKLRASVVADMRYHLQYDAQVRFLLRQNLTSETNGISPEPISETEVIVSLTTHGRRIYDAYLAIESILQGSIKPNRIILWLSNEMEGQPLPVTLQRQQKRGLEVKYIQDMGPYTKSVPAMLAYPKACIVTIDDDILYPYDTLEMLVTTHGQYPGSICANRILDVQFNKAGRLSSIPTWPEMTDKYRISTLNFFEGVGSVLYPPHCFTKEDLDYSLFSSFCPTADDVWMNVLALHHHIDVVPANQHYIKFPLLINESVQDSALWQLNSDGKETRNDLQLIKSLDYFKINFRKN